ncbi:MAG: hypothetical protein GX154_01880 [Clostridiales bacterium]|nr:hypothetical protein [Clostridiales bacterium]
MANFEVFLPGNFSDKLHHSDIDAIISDLPNIKEPVRDSFLNKAKACLDEVLTSIAS